MKRNLEMIQSELIDGEIKSADVRGELSLSLRGQTFLQFCMPCLTDDDLINFCNFILQTADLVEDRFEFNHYDTFYCYSVNFDDRARRSSYLAVYVDEFPNLIVLQYISHLDFSSSKEIRFEFESLEQSEQVVNDFIKTLDTKENYSNG